MFGMYDFGLHLDMVGIGVCVCVCVCLSVGKWANSDAS